MNNFFCFWNKPVQYNKFIAYLLKDNKLFILAKSDEKYYLIDIKELEIYNTNINIHPSYKNNHIEKINNGIRLNENEAKGFIKDYFEGNFIKEVNYVDDINNKYFGQNRLIIYIKKPKKFYQSMSVRSKYLLPLDIDINFTNNNVEIKVITIYKIDINKYRIMI
ncbi:hypothetical protein [Brachyspira hampsonii]|nr:hypothetical protein [Brachyspira hampsonii]